MSRLQALPLATHARTHSPILDRQPFCGSPPVVPPTGGDNGAVMERGRTRAGSVRRTHDDAGFQALANSPTTLRRSGRAIRLLRKHIWQRARFNYRFKVTRLCCSFFCPLAWALSYDIESDIFFRFPKCYFRGSILHLSRLREIQRLEYRTRTLLHFRSRTRVHQSLRDEWAKKLILRSNTGSTRLGCIKILWRYYYFQFG